MIINNEKLNDWLRMPPELNNDFELDKQNFTAYIALGKNFLAKLPTKKKRNSKEQDIAKLVIATSRNSREKFLDKYVTHIYKKITHNFLINKRLTDLILSASQIVPGLVPSYSEIREEQNLQQAHKEGIEIDQAIFFKALFKKHDIGEHILQSMLIPTDRALNLQKEFKVRNELNLDLVHIKYENEEAYLTINNQRHLNSENNQLIIDMETAVDLVLLDTRVKVAVLRGGVMTHPRYAGRRVFCSGIDLQDLYAGKICFVEFLLSKEIGYLRKIQHGIMKSSMNIQKMWIAVVDSFAIGGGMQILLVFDKVIASNDSYFSLPAAQEGIIPGLANYRLPKIIGDRLTKRVIFGGEKIYADGPYAHLICDEVVSKSAMEDAIKRASSSFKQQAVLENKKMLNLGDVNNLQICKYLSEFAYTQAIRLYSEDVLKRLESFCNRMHEVS